MTLGSSAAWVPNDRRKPTTGDNRCPANYDARDLVAARMPVLGFLNYKILLCDDGVGPPRAGYSGSTRRFRFLSACRFFDSKRRSFAARGGFVAVRFFGTCNARAINAASRSSAACLFWP
jgi:hypothetical protein